MKRVARHLHWWWPHWTWRRRLYWSSLVGSLVLCDAISAISSHNPLAGVFALTFFALAIYGTARGLLALYRRRRAEATA
jgi:hypothetical protein